jgi:hypothetical protein
MGALTTPIGRSGHGEHLMDGFLCQLGRGVNEKIAQWEYVRDACNFSRRGFVQQTSPSWTAKTYFEVV